MIRPERGKAEEFFNNDLDFETNSYLPCSGACIDNKGTSG